MSYTSPRRCMRPANNSYFATYELIKRKLSPSPGLLPNGDAAPAPPLSIGAVILAGGSAGVGMWAIAIPPDVSSLLFLQVGQIS